MKISEFKNYWRPRIMRWFQERADRVARAKSFVPAPTEIIWEGKSLYINWNEAYYYLSEKFYQECMIKLSPSKLTEEEMIYAELTSFSDWFVEMITIKNDPF